MNPIAVIADHLEAFSSLGITTDETEKALLALNDAKPEQLELLGSWVEELDSALREYERIYSLCPPHVWVHYERVGFVGRETKLLKTAKSQVWKLWRKQRPGLLR